MQSLNRLALTVALVCLPSGLLLQGCAEVPPFLTKAKPEASVPTCDVEMSPTEKTRLAGIEQMINDGKFYAALAQLDALGVNAPQARLTRAEALRRTEKQAEAQALYLGLIDTCFDGQAHHGLGLLLAKQGINNESLAHLQSARKALPTDSRIRGDLGYALLLAGRWQEARFEFLTALDLNPQDARAARNLVLLTLKQGDKAGAQALADKLGLDKAAIDKLQKQASELKLEVSPPQEAASSSSGAAS